MAVQSDDDAERIESGYLLKSLGKALSILDILYQSRRPMRVGELAQHLGVSASAVSRIISTLSAGGLVEQDEDTGRCRLGLGLALLGNAALGSQELDYIAVPAMMELSRQFREYVSLSRLYRGKVVLLRGRTGESVQRDITLNVVLPAHACAAGKLLLAWKEPEAVQALLRTHGMDPYTSSTITSISSFMAELQKIRRDGFSLDDQELIDGLRHVATPIRDHTGAIVAALSAGGPAAKVQGEELQVLVQAMRRASLEISRRLGYRGLQLETPNDPGPALPAADALGHEPKATEPKARRKKSRPT